MVKDYLIFVRELPKSFGQIGAMLPSSSALAKVMVSPLNRYPGARRILEVGPGTGPFTRQILRMMGDEDIFVICEINPRFMDRLKKTLLGDKYYWKHRDRVVFFEGPVQALPGSSINCLFDVIVSSLPFVNFSPEVVDNIFEQFAGMLRPGGMLTFLQYAGVWKFRELFSSKETRKRVRGVEDVIEKWSSRARTDGEVIRKLSLLNFPPALSVQLVL